MSHPISNQWATPSPTNEPTHLHPMSHHISNLWVTTSSTIEPTHLQPMSHLTSNQWALHLQSLSHHISNQSATQSPTIEPPNLKPLSHQTCPTREPPHLQPKSRQISNQWATPSPTTVVHNIKRSPADLKNKKFLLQTYPDWILCTTWPPFLLFPKVDTLVEKICSKTLHLQLISVNFKWPFNVQFKGVLVKAHLKRCKITL